MVKRRSCALVEAGTTVDTELLKQQNWIWKTVSGCRSTTRLLYSSIAEFFHPQLTGNPGLWIITMECTTKWLLRISWMLQNFRSDRLTIGTISPDSRGKPEVIFHLPTHLIQTTMKSIKMFCSSLLLLMAVADRWDIGGFVEGGGQANSGGLSSVHVSQRIHPLIRLAKKVWPISLTSPWWMAVLKNTATEIQKMIFPWATWWFPDKSKYFSLLKFLLIITTRISTLSFLKTYCILHSLKKIFNVHFPTKKIMLMKWFDSHRMKVWKKKS